MKIFSLNNKVRVKLTEKGKDILKHSIHTGEMVDENTFECQLWQIMNIFGEYLYNGNTAPIHPNMEIDEKDLR